MVAFLPMAKVLPNGLSDGVIKKSVKPKADVDSIDGEMYNEWESYEMTDEFIKKVPYVDRHAFLRSLANKTSELKQGERKNIVIFTATRVYFYAATGYMNGNIEEAHGLGKTTNAKIKAWMEVNDSVDTSGTTFDTWTQDYGSKRGRDGWDHVNNGHPGETGQIDDVDEQEQGSDAFRYSWESDGDFQEDFQIEEELLPGSMFFDGERAF
ncbi:MAG: hypothetical protein IJP27_09405 [Clostridia bacterium]|nr:hypothetical protein [Clostridia bacterium]